MININILKKLHGTVGQMDLNVDIEIEQGNFVALSGESGSGKTTLLRILAGLEDVKSGTIKVDNDEFEPSFILGAIEEKNIFNSSQIPVFCAQKK